MSNNGVDVAARSQWGEVFDHFVIDINGAVAVVTINRPEQLNSMAVSFWTQLPKLLGELEADPAIRVVVITGAGERAFSAGGDIDSFGALTDEPARRAYVAECMLAFSAVEQSPLTIIAAVNGWALGGGCELAFACDMVIASEAAVFGLPEAAIGLVPGFGVLRGPSILGRQWSKYLVLTGETIDAHEAHAQGMVQRVVAPAALLDEALRVGDRVAAHAPLAVTAAKRIINRDNDTKETCLGIDVVVDLLNSEDFKEGRAAFLAGRAPTFNGT
jgi:enoyl-CoA hydratase